VPAFGVGFILIWELFVWATGTPAYLLPGPIAIAKSIWKLISTGLIATHLLVTLCEVMIGYLIAIAAGLTLGALIAQIKIIEKTFKPYLIAFGAIPKIALAPLFIVWFGFGIASKIAVSALVAFFPLLINTINGLNSADTMKLELFKSLGATKWQTFWMLKAPNAMPYLFAGLDIGAVFSVSGAIVGEFVGSQGGLGHLALRMQYEFNIPGYFAVLLIIVPMGLLLHFIVTAAQKRAVFWINATNK
jgi:NitT/TauT family transport system permease protein